jgi:hypothetical protein
MPALGALCLRSMGLELETGPEALGPLKDSSSLAADPAALRQRMAEEGYLYLPGYLDKDQVLAARMEMLRRISEKGFLDASQPLEEGVCLPHGLKGFSPELSKGNSPMQDLLYSGRMMEFYRAFLGGPILHYDFTWIRTVAPGQGTPPHYDIVYMGRGTKNLYTAWTPLGDTSLEMGGLMILENSHKHEVLKATYGSKDVDAYCSNRPDADKYLSGEKGSSGWLTKHPVRIRQNLGGRWLTGEFKAGDLLTFSMYTLHASLDNQSRRLRLSTDSRYQLASEPADGRWIGENPPGHSQAGKRGKIC